MNDKVSLLTELIEFCDKTKTRAAIILKLSDMKKQLENDAIPTCLDNQTTCKFNENNLCKRINFCKFKS